MAAASQEVEPIISVAAGEDRGWVVISGLGAGLSRRDSLILRMEAVELVSGVRLLVILAVVSLVFLASGLRIV